MKTRYAIPVVLMLLSLAAGGSGAEERWWDTGHAHITRGAIQHLPQPLRSVFQAHAEVVSSDSGIEPPGDHWIDIDYYPEFFQGTLPHDLDELVALYGWDIVLENGIGPWMVGSYAEALADQMSAAQSGQAWTDLLETAAALAHYVEDHHNPLHLTLNYNGQLTGNYGVHGRYEGQMINRHLADDLDIIPAAGPCVCHASLVDALFDTIDVHYWYVDDIMDADTIARGHPPTYGEAYYAAMWTYTGGFTHTLFQEASQFVASAWYTAWVNAGSPPPLLDSYGDVNCDGMVDFGDINPYVLLLSSPDAWQAVFPDCPWLSGDCNHDGAVNFDDLSAFVALLSGD